MRHQITVVLFTAAFLCLVNLGQVAFWDDEAHVALFARALLKTHTNSAWDGRNLVPDHNAAGYDAELVNLFPQLDNYVTAVSVKIFGDSPWAARLPFALCGIGVLLVFWRLLLLEFPGLPALQLYALGAAAFSAPMLLYFRNCRYYALSALLTMGILLCYRRFLQGHRLFDAIAIGVMAGLLSLSSILNCTCLLGGLLLRHLIFHRNDFCRKSWLKVTLSLLIGAAFALPYVWGCLLPSMARGSAYAKLMNFPSPPPFPVSMAERLWMNLTGLSIANALPWSVALGLLVFLLWKPDRQSAQLSEAHPQARLVALEFLATIAGFILVLSAISPQNPVTSSIADLRYFTPILPLTAALVGIVFWWIHQKYRLVAVCLLGVYWSTNLLGLTPPNNQPRLLLPDFIKEIVSPYPTAISETGAFLRENSNQDDTIWYWPDYMGKPLMYYLGDRLKLRGILDRNTLLPEPTVKKLEPDLFIENVFPNWVVSFGRHQEVKSTVGGFSRPLPGTNRSYRYTLAKVINIYQGQTQRPELQFHSFGPWRGYDPGAHSVYIFRRSQEPEQH